MTSAPSNVAELAQAFVRIPSVNPDGDPGTDRTGEEACAVYLRDFLSSLGAQAHLQPVLPGRPNVVARFPASGDKPRLLFAPHTDTVSVLGMTINPFGGEIREGRLHGRGSCDTKGPMASMLWALRECREILPHLSHEIWFAGLMGEEAGQGGSKALAAAETFDFVVVGEPTGLDVVFKHKADFTVRITATGRSAHSSRPDLGENAIVKLATGLLALKESLERHFGEIRDPILGSPTFSIGTIRGGSKFNIVPDHAEAVVNMRLLPSQWKDGDAKGVMEAMHKACPGLAIECVASSGTLDTDPSHPLVAKLASDGSRLVGAPWFCDAAVFSSHGMPAVAVGPGSIEQAHTKDEFIGVDELGRGVDYFKKFLHGLRVG